jgi:hypothetical protein
LAALVVGGIALAPRNAAAVDSDDINKAIDRGVAHLKQSQRTDGSWGGDKWVLGASALAALTLLECDVPPDDPVLVKATAYIRKGALTTLDTYCIATCIFFLDRLGEPVDELLIDSLTVRLLGGQNESGAYTYTCPAPPPSEVTRLTTAIEKRTELTTRKDLKGPRTIKDLPEPIQAQLLQLANTKPVLAGADNSNTQFADMALWIARRHGLPTEGALGRLGDRFRKLQTRDGGWSYAGGPATPTMTCAGILGLITSVAGSLPPERGKTVRPVVVESDPQLVLALNALGTTVGDPVGDRKEAIPKVSGRTFYFLWSLERVCVGLDMKLLGNKDWYAWGSEILVANQGGDGSWRGEFAAQEADTCFALLFLKKANLIRDLTASVRGKFKKLGERTLGTGAGPLPKRLSPGIEGAGPGDTPAADPKRPVGPASDPRADQPTGRLAGELINASADDQAGVLAKLRDGKGVEYTEALASAIGRLDGDRKQQAREALAQRLGRMKPETLKRYLHDEEPEIRRGAVLACVSREMKALVPDLIPLLKDRAEVVVQAAHGALKDLTGEKLGPDAAAWEEWWKKHGKD